MRDTHLPSAEAAHMPVIGVSQLLAAAPRFDLVSFVECTRLRCACIDQAGGLALVVEDANDLDLIAWATSVLGPFFKRFLASPEVMDAWLTHSESGLSALKTVAVSTKDVSSDLETNSPERLSLAQIESDLSPAIRLVNSTLFDALRVGASDIHLETGASGSVVKFRIDGVLSVQTRIDSLDLANQMISRIKVLAQLDIAERRIPQDGRLQIQFEDRTIDVRVSIMPSIHGEDAVLRVLDRQHLASSLAGLTLNKLGFNEDAIAAIERWSRKSNGMLLVTGPTGSGKTTTLYATLAQTHNPRDKVITIEDPVEYQLPGVLQIPVNERKGLTFAKGLRSILRHDPDQILVGEIRDSETAQIATQSALTGHLVFTTVHANNVFDVLGRFTQFGIDAYTFSSAINGIVSQRLLRKVCRHCAVTALAPADLPSSDDVAQLCIPSDVQPVWLKAVGCAHCRGAGYSGRFALGEILELSPAMKGLLATRAPLDQLQELAAQNGWRSLRALALQSAAMGLTTLEEVNRVAS